MEQIKNILKKNWKMILVGVAVLFGIPLVAIHLLYKWKSGIYFFEAEWDAGELLGYIGTMLSFVGTLILGYLALEASNRANELSQKVIKLEEEQHKLNIRPFVLVSDWNAYEICSSELIDFPKKKYIQIGDYKNGNALGLAIELTNTTESYVSVQYSTGSSRDPEICWKNASINQQNLKMMLAPGEKEEFVFYASPSFMKKLEHQRITIELILENRFSKRYKETFVIIITSLSEKVYPTSKKWFCHMFAQEYSITSFDQNEDAINDEEKLR